MFKDLKQVRNAIAYMTILEDIIFHKDTRTNSIVNRIAKTIADEKFVVYNKLSEQIFVYIA